MNQVLLLALDVPKEAIQLLKSEVEVAGPFRPDNDWRVHLNAADAIITSSQFQLSGDVMALSNRLRVIGRPGIGVDNVDVAAATARGICVVNTPDAPTEPVAEKVVGWIIALAHRLYDADRIARVNGWLRRDSLRGHDLVGKTLGLVGVGRVGSRVAEICSGAFRMRVLGYDPYVNLERTRHSEIKAISNLDALLSVSDFISLHCPLTDETRGMIGARQLSAMKPTAYLINAARAQIVDQAALVQALREGRIAGAALDVFSSEPASPGDPLLQMDNVILAPHIGSFTDEGVMRMFIGTVEQVLMVLKGQRPPNLVNPKVWERRR